MEEVSVQGIDQAISRDRGVPFCCHVLPQIALMVKSDNSENHSLVFTEFLDLFFVYVLAYFSALPASLN